MEDHAASVGQSRLNEHLLAMKDVVEHAAKELPEPDWRIFADMSEKAILKAPEAGR